MSITAITAITSNTAGPGPITGDFAALLTPVQTDSVPAHQTPRAPQKADGHNDKKPEAVGHHKKLETGGHHYPKVMPQSGRPL